MMRAVALFPIAFVLSLRALSLADDPPVRMDPIPTGLPPTVAAEFQSRAAQLDSVKVQLQAATNSWNSRCEGIAQGAAGYDACVKEAAEIGCGRNSLYGLRREFNIDLEAAARAAGVADHLTLTNVSIEGEVNFPVPDGTNIVDGKIGSIRVSTGTKIVTGPTGRFSASIPGGNAFEVGAGAQVILDSTFVNPHVTDKVDVDLSHGFFRWLRNAVDDIKQRANGTGKYGVKRQGVCAVRG